MIEVIIAAILRVVIIFLAVLLIILSISYVNMVYKTHLEKRKSRYLRMVYPTGDHIGKWIVLSDRTVRCPFCGKIFNDAYCPDFADRFCRNCGECMDDGKEDRNN